MRKFIWLAAAVAAPALLFAQTITAPGAYSAPFVPRVETPTAIFVNPPLQVGASNVTEGLGTLSLEPPAQSLHGESAGSKVFNTGASMPQDAFGLAELAERRAASKPAVRTFTNSDVDRLHASQ